MNTKTFHLFRKIIFFSTIYICGLLAPVIAQQGIGNKIQDLKTHGIEQFHESNYELAAHSLSKFLKEHKLSPENRASETIYFNHEEAKYYLIVSQIKQNSPNATKEAEDFIKQSSLPVFKQRAAFFLAQHYFQNNHLEDAIYYYELAGIENLSNKEIADSKFELAYSYFNNQQFNKALPLFAAIKELPNHNYYVPGNYYYGLLAYNNKNYSQALRSFTRIVQEETYKEIVPYYKAEIYYFIGEPDKVLEISKNYLDGKEDLYYYKEMRLLTAQTLFEKGDYAGALPHFEYYYEHTDRIRKEELYELAYTYYRLEQWEKAIQRFQPLSNAQDSLGQTSMYLLGDCYLKLDDKKGARNAFGICSEMDFNHSQKEAATFLYGKLSYELGDEGLATRTFHSFLQEFEESSFENEAKTLLTSLLAKNSNYAEAFQILSDMSGKDNPTWAIYQQVAIGRAMQLLQNKQYAQADSILSLSLQQPINPHFEAIAYFWKGEIAFIHKRYPQAIQFSQTFIDKSTNTAFNIQQISEHATKQNALLNIGHAQLELEQFSEAQMAFADAQKGTLNREPTIIADAKLREADAYFMQNDFKNASKSYDEAIALNISNPDYARFQKSLIAGLEGNQQEKKSMLESIIQKSPPSAYKNQAQLELAVTSLETGELAKAIQLLNELNQEEGLPANMSAKALNTLGYAYQQNAQTEKAIETYEQFLIAYPSSTEKEFALSALSNLYFSISKPEEYIAFLKENNMPNLDEETIENTFYDAAIKDFANQEYGKSTVGFTKYLDQFPHGRHATKARFYRAESYENRKERNQALADYEAVLEDGWSDFAEESAKKAAVISFTNGNYENAYRNYEILKEVVVSESNLHIAYLGLSRSSFELGNYELASNYIDTLIAFNNLDNSIAWEAQLYKAKSLQEMTNFAEALSYYKKIENEQIGSISAEAKYRIAEILLAQNQLKEAEEQAAHSAQNSGGQEYWIVKSYMLLSDVLVQQEDYFNAKAILNGIIKDKSTNPAVQELINEASGKLENVLQLEKENSKLEY